MGVIKALISEIFIGLMTILFIVVVVLSVKGRMGEWMDEVRCRWEEIMLNRRIISRLKSTPPAQLRSAAMDVMLIDVEGYKDWLEKRSILPEDVKRSQLQECRETMWEQRKYYGAMMEGMSDAEILEMLARHVTQRDADWRLRLLRKLES